VPEVDTSGAAPWTGRPLHKRAPLTVANYRDGNMCNVKSRIYRQSTTSGRFELVQEIITSGASDWEGFTPNGAICLAVANFYDSGTYSLKSRIYRHSEASNQSELAQEVTMSGAVDWLGGLYAD
jgi:hypothetical protein